MTQQKALALFSYDPSTGALIWRERPASDFKSSGWWKYWRSKYAGKEAGGIHAATGYRRVRIDGFEWKAHRLIWLMVHGREPAEVMDHINGNKTDNRIENLREVSPADNARNMARSVRNQSSVTGVAFRQEDRIWRAHIGVDGKSLDLGSYATFEEARAARKAAEKVLGYHENHGRKAA